MKMQKKEVEKERSMGDSAVTLDWVFRSLDIYECVCQIICIKLEETVTIHRRRKRPICAPRGACDGKMTFQSQMSLPQS